MNATERAACMAALEALTMTTMLKRCGGMLPGVRELILSAVEDAEAAIPALHAVLAQPTQPKGEPFGTVAEYAPPGPNHVARYEFYKWPLTPYLDNASECHVVYTAPQRVAQPDDSERLRIAIREALPFTMLMGQKILVKALSAPTAHGIGEQP
jgi:hypothetical protein